jgi:hypothetical protein
VTHSGCSSAPPQRNPLAAAFIERLNRFKVWRLERPHYRAFERFYETLEDKQNVFYMFFTSGLLHWLARTSACVPANVNLVLIGSGLDPEEQGWIRDNIKRPFHHVELRVDDVTIWEFLFRANRHNFGWLDVDCFVLNPNLFLEMVSVPTDVAINCTWTFPGPANVDILCTHFVFINVDVARKVRQSVDISPCTYNNDGSRDGRDFSSYAFSRIPSKKALSMVRKVIPADAEGQPLHPQKVGIFHFPCYDTLVLYQLVCQSLGYRLNKVRALDGHDTGAITEDLVHVVGVSYYDRSADTDHDGIKQFYQFRLQLDYLLTSGLVTRLPSGYERRKAQLAERCAALNLSLDTFSKNVFSVLVQSGISRDVIARRFPELKDPVSV